MRNPFFHGAGGVLSADIAVPDHQRELDFYTKILTTGENPLWRDDLMNNCGWPIIGLGARTPEYDSIPLQWMPHFQVADVASSAAAAINSGGKELMHGKDEQGHSQWAVVEDPDGAAFGIIPVVPPDPGVVHTTDRVGKISWLSLTVPDPDSSHRFYRQVVGWSANPIESIDGDVAGFEMQGTETNLAAEICRSDSDGMEIPAVWLIHVTVDDLAESLRQVNELGGQVVGERSETQVAIIKDPIGIYFALQAG